MGEGGSHMGAVIHRLENSSYALIIISYTLGHPRQISPAVLFSHAFLSLLLH